jgi:hypothetical protein
MTSSSGNIASGDVVQSGSSGIKVATPDLIVFDNSSLSVDSMSDLIFEDIGGQELLEISRSDFINSSRVSFPKIKSRSTATFNKAIATAAGGDTSFPSQAIRLSDHVPQFQQPVLLNIATGSIVVSVINILPEYQVEIQIVSKASRFDDTIYTEDQGGES